MRGSGLVVVLLTLLASGASAAADEVIVDRTGAYVGLGGAGAGQADERRESDSGVGGGFRAEAGYRLHGLLGTDVQIEWIDDLVGGPDNQKVDVWTVTASAKLFLPPWRNGQLYFLAAPGIMGSQVETSQDDDEEFVARFGGGIEVAVTRSVLATLGVVYVMPTGDLDDLDYVSGAIGLQYRF
jgi:opacity protein-like surface antigen